MNATVRGFVRKELAQALRDKRMRILIFGVPVIQMLLFGFALSTDVKNIRLAVEAKASDSLARDIRDTALASGWFVQAETYGNDPYLWVKRGEAEAVLVAPPGGMAEAAERGRGEVQLLVDAANSLRARQIEFYVRRVMSETALRRGVAQPRPAVNIQTRILYNPEMRSAIFQVPGVMCMIMCIITIILTAMSIAKEKESGTFETIISAPVSNWEILGGKTIPYVLLGLANVPIVLGTALLVFDVPMRGSYVHLFLTALLFVFTTVSIGTAISTFTRTQQQAMMASFMFLFPAVLLSGLMFPVENMPDWAKIAAYLDPLYYFINILRNILLKGGTPEVLLYNSAILALMGTAVFVLAVTRFKQKLA